MIINACGFTSLLTVFFLFIHKITLNALQLCGNKGILHNNLELPARNSSERMVSPLIIIRPKYQFSKICRILIILIFPLNFVDFKSC